MLREVRFTFEHEKCWLLETTKRYPSMTLVVSAVYSADDDIHVDLMVHAPTRAQIDQAWAEWKTDSRIRKISKLYEGPKGVRFHVAYEARNSIYPHIIHHTPISLGAISMACGIEYYHIIGESDGVQGLLQELNQHGVARVQSIRDLQEFPLNPEPDSVPAIARELTDKQLEALLLAHLAGYYRWPRAESAAELAERIGLSSAAFLDHLRRAEAKALDSVVNGFKAADPARFEAVRSRLSAARSKPKRAQTKKP